MKKLTAVFLALLCMASFMVMPAMAAAEISIDVTRPTGKYDGTERSSDFYLYGGSTYYSWVEYTIDVAETGLYRLDAVVSVSAGDTAQLRISVDGEDVEGIFDVAPSSIPWEKRDTMLHDKVPLYQGTRVIRITQAELISHVTLNQLSLTKTADLEVATSVDVDVTAPVETFDGTGRDKDFFFYGGSAMNHSWAKFEVEVPNSGTYRPDIKITTDANKESGLRMEIDGVMMNETLHIPADPGNYVLRSFTMPEISLTEGTHIIRIYQTVGATATTLNYLSLTKTGEYARPTSVTILGSTAKSMTVENLSFAGDGYRERAQVRGGHALEYALSMPTGMYDISLLVSASEDYQGFVTTIFGGVTTQEEAQVPAEYATDAEAKDGFYYEMPVAENVWFHSGDNVLEVKGGSTNTKLFYLRGIVIRPSEKHWVAKTALSAFDEETETVTASVYAENNYSEEDMNMVAAVAVYDENGELLKLEEKPLSVANGVPTEETFAVSVPEQATHAKLFLWEGTSIYESSMMYYAETVESVR